MDKEVVVYIYNAKLFSHLKIKEILPFVTTWMDLEGIMLSEMSDKDKYCIIPQYVGS